jgi:hypothetical protein
VEADRTEVNDFWKASPARQAMVLQAFRQAGAVMAVADSIPKNADKSGWKRVLSDQELRLPANYQPSLAPYCVYKWLIPTQGRPTQLTRSGS